MNAKQDNITDQLRKMAKTEYEGLQAAVLSDVVDNQNNLTDVITNMSGKLDKFITAQELKNQDIEDNTKDIKDIKKQNKLLATIGGGISAVLTGISAWFLSKL